MKARQLYYVIGLGQTGLSVVRYLQRKQQECEVFDDKISPNGLADFQKEFPDIKIHLHENPIVSVEHMEKIHEVIISPGVPLEHPVAQKALELGIPVIGDIELFARENTAPIVAITGTNGKSTVTTLVGEMVKAAGLNVLVGGNIGTPVLDFLTGEANQKPFDWVVLELSSFQLDSTYTLHPKIACILNITEDHMDRYECFEAYVASKHRVYEGAENLVVSEDDALTCPKTPKNNQNVVRFGILPPSLTLPHRGGGNSIEENFNASGLNNDYSPRHSREGGNPVVKKPIHYWHIQEKDNKKYLAYNQENWLDVNELKIKGTHNWSNALAALAMGKLMGLEQSVMCQVLKTFPGLDHRCQWVRELNEVNWYNDSKGTNVGATLSAINGFGGTLAGKIVLLLGGQSKGADFKELCEPLKSHVRAVILYGEDADKIEGMLKKSPNMISIIRKTTFKEVIEAANQAAKPGDAVLLSPSCASWDMFNNYVHRGIMFTELVLAL